MDCTNGILRLFAPDLKARFWPTQNPEEPTLPAIPSSAKGSSPIIQNSIEAGRYVLVRRAGEGDFGAVYEARDTVLQRRVALRCLNERRNLDPDAKRRLRIETKATARLSHPNILQVHDIAEHNDELFIVTEFVEGCSLAHWLEASDRSMPEIRELLSQVGRGLRAAHECGALHGDIRATNVLVDRDGNAFVSNFAAGEIPLLSPADFLLPPERLLCERISAKTDIFSYCAMSWQALLREAPFSSKSVKQYLVDVRSGEIHLSHTRPPLPSRLEQLLRRGLSANPRDRPSLDEILVALAVGRTGRTLTPIYIIVALLLGSALSLGYLLLP